MTTDYLDGSPGREPGGATAVRVTVSFAGTDKSVIQSDNFLAAGIAAQGPDNREEGLLRWDWGYTLLLVLDGVEDDPYIQGAIWEFCEWGEHGLWPLEPPTSELVSSWTWSYPDILRINSEVMLTMKWNASHLNYFATIGGVVYSLYSYTPTQTQMHYFMLGTCDREKRIYPDGPAIPLGETVKWFQFPGAWSLYPIGLGWQSRIKYPHFQKINEPIWKYVDFAYSVHGDISWLDNTVMWGGMHYTGVDAHYYCEPWSCLPREVIFYPTSDGSTIPSYTLLWEPASGSGGGGGGCPYLYTWNGQRYLVDNNLLPATEISNDADVDDYYRLEQPLAPIYQGIHYSLYSLQIREFEQEHDYLDKVNLLAVNHDSDVNVAVTPLGEILTYRNPIPPVSAVDETGTDVLSLLSSVDENYYQGHNGSNVMLTFAPVNLTHGAKLVIRSDDRPPLLKSPVYVQTLNAPGDWCIVAVFHTRTYWATDIINMTGFLPDPQGDLKIRLCFVSNDKIDYIGFDTTPQADVQVQQAYFVFAIHSTQGNVKPLLIENDQNYAELFPGELIHLTFLLPNNQNGERTFIFYAEGHYETIS